MGRRATHRAFGSGTPRPGQVGLALAAALVVAGLLTVAAGASTSGTVVTVTQNKTWGPILTLGNGDTLYRFTPDPKNMSVCTGACARAWPPVLLAKGQKKPIGDGVRGLGTITRANGARQVTYEGLPLYLYIGDHRAGQVNGNIKDAFGQWWTVNPAYPTAVPKARSSSGSSTTGASAGSSVAY